jgi:hypothetical protein
MGCASCRSQEDLEESFVKQFESELGYSKKKSVEIDKCFYSFAFDSKIPNKQFLEAVQELELEVEDFDALFSPKVNLYQCLKTEDGLYSARRLSTLGILLGQGDIRDKAKLLYKNYEIKSSNNSNLQRLIEDSLNISMNLLPWYGLNIANDQETKRIVGEYWKVLKTLKFSEQEFYEKILIKNEKSTLNLNEFIDLLLYTDAKNLVSSTKVRRMAMENKNKSMNKLS